MADYDNDALSYAESMPVKPFRYGINKAWQNIQKAQAGAFYFTIGVSTIDKWLRLYPTTYNVFAAESGVGKTTLTLQAASNIEMIKRQRQDERRTVIFSAEMTADQLAHKQAAAYTGISVERQWGGELTDAEMERLREALFDVILPTQTFEICDDNRPDADRVREVCDIAAAEYGLAVVIFDYVELASTDFRNKQDHVPAVAEMLADVARDYGAVCIGVSQLNKDKAGRANKRPQMTDLRYGGEKPASSVLIAQDRTEEVFTDSDMRPITWWLVKNRFGRKDVGCDTLFDGAAGLFKPADFRLDEFN